MDKLIGWLVNECSTGATGGTGCATTPESFHFYIPWLGFCVLAILVAFYYQKEGRKRFFGSHTLHKALLDRFTPHLMVIGIVGLVLVGCRVGGVSVFGLRLWRYAWALWVLGFFGYWAYYMLARYRSHLAAYNRQRTLERYMPQPRPKRERKTARA